MELTPQVVSEAEFREAKRGGYNIRDVDDFLDQVAVQVGHLHDRIHEGFQRAEVAEAHVVELQSHLESARAQAAAQPPVPGAADMQAGMPPVPPGAGPGGEETDEMLRRTLQLAQRTADATIAEAQNEAARLLDEARAEAAQAKASAEANVVGDVAGARERAQAEVDNLLRRRDEIEVEVAQLEEQLRAKRAGLKADLEDLQRLLDEPGPLQANADQPSQPSQPSQPGRPEPAPAPAPLPPRSAPQAEPQAPMFPLPNLEGEPAGSVGGLSNLGAFASNGHGPPAGPAGPAAGDDFVAGSRISAASLAPYAPEPEPAPGAFDTGLGSPPFEAPPSNPFDGGPPSPGMSPNPFESAPSGTNPFEGGPPSQSSGPGSFEAALSGPNPFEAGPPNPNPNPFEVPAEPEPSSSLPPIPPIPPRPAPESAPAPGPPAPPFEERPSLADQFSPAPFSADSFSSDSFGSEPERPPLPSREPGNQLPSRDPLPLRDAGNVADLQELPGTGSQGLEPSGPPPVPEPAADSSAPLFPSSLGPPPGSTGSPGFLPDLPPQPPGGAPAEPAGVPGAPPAPPGAGSGALIDTPPPPPPPPGLDHLRDAGGLSDDAGSAERPSEWGRSVFDENEDTGIRFGRS